MSAEPTSGVDVRQVIAEAIREASWDPEFNCGWGPTLSDESGEFLADAVLAALPGLEATT